MSPAAQFEYGRFSVQRKLGGGGLGVVYEVLDTATGQRLALKSLLGNRSTEEMRRLKAEFRILSDISHPNLVGMHELHVGQQASYFTMDLVAGGDIIQYALTGRLKKTRNPPASGEWLIDKEGAAPASSREGWSWDQTIEARVRDTFSQLAEGIATIHRYGVMHRDLKPSNILVTEEGRVVLLDFGIACDESSLGSDQQSISGTPAYMSPEQARGETTTLASDWYAFGGILFEMLFGFAPFSSQAESPLQFLLLKRLSAPTFPETASERPPDLVELCRALLKLDPKARPTQEEVLRHLAQPEFPRFASSPPPNRAFDFVGRRDELAELHVAFQKCLGTPTIVEIIGEAGIGKTALAQAFLRDLEKETDVHVLRGRCHEREMVPYKAFDEIVDHLATMLKEEQRRGCGLELLPATWGYAVSLFPSLGTESRAHLAPFEARDPLEFRQAAFEALREVLRMLASRAPLVLFIDDVQWADNDSQAILRELFQAGFPVLLLAASRPSEEPCAFVRELRRIAEQLAEKSSFKLDLGPLTTQDSLKLAGNLFQGQHPDEALSSLVADAAGNPFLLCQLGQYASTLAQGSGRAAVDSIESVLSERILVLLEEARLLLEVLSVAGRPLDQELLLNATEGGSAREDIQRLKRVHLVRSLPGREQGDSERVATFHDRIREAVVNSLPADRLAEIHRALGRALKAGGDEDLESIAQHHLAASDLEQAREFFVKAARRAKNSLAFDRASALYQRALSLVNEDDPEWFRLNAAWAEVLTAAGRGAEAATPLLVLAKLTEGTQSLAFKQQAAEQLMHCGHFAEGMAIVDAVLRSIGNRVPPQSRRAFLGAAYHHIHLGRHNLEFKRTSQKDADPEKLLRVDAYRAVAWPLSMIDMARAGYVDALCARAALELGEPLRVIQATAAHSGFLSTLGPKSRERAARFAQVAADVAIELDEPYLITSTQIIFATLESNCANWRGLDKTAARLSMELEEARPTEDWVLTWSRILWSEALSETGDWRSQAGVLLPWLRRARLRNNRFLESTLTVFYGHSAFLIDDRPEEAKKSIEDSIDFWQGTPFSVQSLLADVGLARIALYEGTGAEWLLPMKRLETRRLRSGLRFYFMMAVLLESTIGACALRTAEAHPDQAKKALKQAKRSARALLAHRLPYCDGAAELLLSGVAHLEDRAEGAEQHLSRAIDALDASGRRMHAAAARSTYAHISKAPDASERGEQALRYFREQSAQAPEKIVRLLAPGFNRSAS